MVRDSTKKALQSFGDLTLGSSPHRPTVHSLRRIFLTGRVQELLVGRAPPASKSLAVNVDTLDSILFASPSFPPIPCPARFAVFQNEVAIC